MLEARHVSMKRVTHEANHLFQVGMTVVAALQQVQVAERLLLYAHQHTSQHLLPQHGIGLE